MVYDAIIPAAGRSSRYGGDKLAERLGQTTVLQGALACFVADDHCASIWVVTAADRLAFWQKQLVSLPKVTVIAGAFDRSSSVLAGLRHVTARHVVIHDGARPFLSRELLASVVSQARTNTCVLPVLEPADSVAAVDGDRVAYLNREKIRLVQTPQCFETDKLKQAFAAAGARAGAYRDEVSLLIDHVALAGVTLVAGDRRNAKITFFGDLPKA